MPILPPPSPDNVKSGSTEPVKKRRRRSQRIENQKPKPLRTLRSNTSLPDIKLEDDPPKPKPLKPSDNIAGSLAVNKENKPTPPPVPPKPSKNTGNAGSVSRSKPTPPPVPPKPSKNNPLTSKLDSPKNTANAGSVAQPTPVPKPKNPVTSKLDSPKNTGNAGSVSRSKPTPPPVPQPQPVPSTSTANESSTGVNRRKRTRDQVTDVEHPFVARLQNKESQLHKLMNDIFHLADNDLLLSDKDSGENDYTMTLKFADKLDFISEILNGLSRQCTDRANKIRDNVDAARDTKIHMQNVILDTDFGQQQHTKTERSDKMKEILRQIHGLKTGYEAVQWIKNYSQLIKREHAPYVSSDDDSDEETFQASNEDTKFKFVKYNNYDETIYKCLECNKKLRDSHELRNHLSNHKLEIYRCLKCLHVSRSVRSHDAHMDTHDRPKLYKCSDPSCGSSFNMKSTLTNHEQMHQERLKCDKCDRTFQYRQGYLEHITFRHLKHKSIPCPSCPKMFWTPTAMRSHRAKQHRLVSDLYHEDADAESKRKKKT